MTEQIAHPRANSNSPPLPPGVDVVLFDGNCGLCHGLVRFLCARPATPRLFRFAPLSGETAKRLLAKSGALPDSVVVVTCEGARLFRFGAVRRVLSRLPGGWRAAAALSRIVPAPLGDLLYRVVARVRHLVFPPPTTRCPIVPPSVSEIFLP